MNPLGITDAQADALRARPWCDGCHSEDRGKLRVTRLLRRGHTGDPTFICPPCFGAWYDGKLDAPGQRCHRGADCPVCAALAADDKAGL